MGATKLRPSQGGKMWNQHVEMGVSPGLTVCDARQILDSADPRALATHLYRGPVDWSDVAQDHVTGQVHNEGSTPSAVRGAPALPSEKPSPGSGHSHDPELERGRARPEVTTFGELGVGEWFTVPGAWDQSRRKAEHGRFTDIYGSAGMLDDTPVRRIPTPGGAG